MKQSWKHLKSEWEIALCAFALLALICSLVAGWMQLHPPAPERASRKQAPRQASLLAPDACAFLKGYPEPTEELPSPFVFEGQTKAPKATVPTSKPPPKTVAARPPEPVVPKVEPKVEPAPAPTPVEPKVTYQKVYGVRFVTYLYNTRGASGRPVAAIQLTDPVTNQTAPPAMLPIGGSADGIRIVSFDEQNLVVLDARGRKHQIAFGKSVRVSSAPQIVEIRQ